jgi:class 3 adenylate cyclase
MVIALTRGDDTQLDYAVIGEPVNLAAKLDKHNKKSGRRLSISSCTCDYWARKVSKQVADIRQLNPAGIV